MARPGNRIQATTTKRLALTPALRRALDLLRMDAEALAALVDEALATNPWLMRPPALPADPMPDIAAPGPGLHAHVLGWIAARIPPGAERDIALALAEALEPTGWLGARPETVAEALGVPVPAVLAVLAQLQRIDPPGLFARDLAECLRLQAAAEGLLDPAMAALLARLDLLARQGPGAVARAARLPEDAVATAATRLRRLDPKPGLRLADDGPGITPAWRTRGADLRAVAGPDGRWHALAGSAGPDRLRLRPGAPPGDPAARAAAELVAQVNQRRRTIETVADAILAVQGAALANGRGALQPLSRAAIAAETGFAASTVGRAVQGVRIATPHGVWPLAAFFTAPLGAHASAAQAETALRALIAAEPPDAPLSDAALAQALAVRGIAASRRTVAKYRDRMGLPPAGTRKRRGGA